MTSRIQTSPPTASSSDDEPPIEKEALASILSFIFDFATFWRQRNAILTDPSIVTRPGAPELKMRPLAFATQAVVFPILVVTVTTWFLSYIGITPPPAETTIASYHEIHVADSALAVRRDSVNRFLAAAHAAERGGAVVMDMDLYLDSVKVVGALARNQRLSFALPIAWALNALKKFGVTLSLLLVGIVFRRSVRPFAISYPVLRHADRIYLYYVISRTYIPALVSLLLVLLTTTVPTTGPHDLSSWLFVPSFALSAWVLVEVFRSARVLEGALSVPRFVAKDGVRTPKSGSIIGNGLAGAALASIALNAGVWILSFAFVIFVDG